MPLKNFLGTALIGLLLSGCAAESTPARSTDEDIHVAFNDRQVGKYLEQYADQLELSHRQRRRVARVRKKYDKREQRLSTLQFGKKRTLQREEGQALLALLTDRQIEWLNELTGKRGLFNRL